MGDKPDPVNIRFLYFILNGFFINSDATSDGRAATKNTGRRSALCGRPGRSESSGRDAASAPAVAPVRLVKQPVALSPDGLSVHGKHECQYEGSTWPIHYDFIEPLAILADIATIVLFSVVAGPLCHYLQDAGTADYVSKSLGSAILVSALFVSLRKSEGCTSRPNCWPWPIRSGRYA